MGITKDVYDILAQNERVKKVFNTGIDALLDAVTGQAPTLQDRKAALIGIVGSLDAVADQVSDYNAYYGALIGVCFDTADVTGRGVLVEDLYAPPHCFYFPVPAAVSSLKGGKRKGTSGPVYGVIDSTGTLQTFLAIKRVDGRQPNTRELQMAHDECDNDEAFVQWLKENGHEVNALVGVSAVDSPPGHQYVPKLPDPLGSDVALTLVRRPGTTRKRLETTLLDHLNTGVI